MSRSLWRGFDPPTTRGSRGAVDSMMRETVHYLFLVRNMFFLGSGPIYPLGASRRIGYCFRMSPKAVRAIRWIWRLFVIALLALSYFGGVSIPRDWETTLSIIALIEAWWAQHAAHPLLAAFAMGLLVGTVLIPALWQQLRPHLFPDKLSPDIDAQDAFDLILSRSKWAKRQRRNWAMMPKAMYEKDRSQSDVIEGRLNQLFQREIRAWLRNEKLACWGSESTSASSIHVTPEKPIEPQRWDEIEISFSRNPANAAYYATGSRAGELAFVHLRFCKRQIRRQFPLAWRR